MIRVIYWSCFFLLLRSASSQIFDCEKSNVGAVQLYLNGETPPNSQGIVIVCVEVEQPPGIYTYQKAAICWNEDSTFNKGAAAAACRQGSYSKQADYNSGSYFGFNLPNNINYYISEIQCPIVKNYSIEGETVLLRCSHTPASYGNISASCPKSELAAVKCYGENITSSVSTYNGQIYIGNLPNLQEPIYPYIKLDGELHPICIDQLSNPNFIIVGRSICRQLGYTDISLNSTVATIKEAWYLGSLLCDSASSSCFTDCFDHYNYTKVSTCDGGDKIGLGLICIYNESNAGVYGSGGGKLCQIETTCPSAQKKEEILTALCCTFGVTTMVLAILCILYGMYKCYRHFRNWYNQLG